MRTKTYGGVRKMHLTARHIDSTSEAYKRSAAELRSSAARLDAAFDTLERMAAKRLEARMNASNDLAPRTLARAQEANPRSFSSREPGNGACDAQ